MDHRDVTIRQFASRCTKWVADLWKSARQIATGSTKWMTVRWRSALVLVAVALLLGHSIMDRWDSLRSRIRETLLPTSWLQDQVGITVAAPSVHTRERLLNDRFEQLDWINDQLDKTQGKIPPVLRLDTSGLKVGTAQASANTGSTAGAGSGDNADSTPAQISSAKQYGRTDQDDPRRWFDMLNGYRDVLRAERARAMLDDRHDMDGNTLYLLSFDTTIMPKPGSRGYAVIEAFLTREPNDLPNIEEVPGGSDSTTRLTSLDSQDRFDVYIDWLGRVKKVATASVDQIAVDISDANFYHDPTFYQFLHAFEVIDCSEILRLMGDQPVSWSIRRSACDEQLQTVSMPAERAGERQLVDDKILKQAADANKSMQSLLEQVRLLMTSDSTSFVNVVTKYLPVVNSIIGPNHTLHPYTSFDRLITLEALLGALLKMPPEIDDHNASDDHNVSNSKLEKLSVRADGNFPGQLLIDFLWDNKFSQPVPIVRHGIGEAARCIAAVFYADSISVASATQYQSHGAAFSEFFDLRIRRTVDNYSSCWLEILPKISSLRMESGASSGENEVQAEYGSDNHSLVVRNGDDLIKWPYNDPKKVSLINFIPIQINGHPNAVVGAKPDAQSKRVVLTLFYTFKKPEDDVVKVSFEPHHAMLDRLWMLLEGPAYTDRPPTPNTEAFVYGLTPRLRQNYALRASESNQASDTLLGRSLGFSDQRSLATELSDPEVVGFTRTRDDAKRSVRGAGFGWLVAPRPTGAGSWESSLPVEQVQLGALVAVPSWWRTALLEVCTGFAKQDDVAMVTQSDFLSKVERCHVQALRLPGTATDLSRRLGVEVVTFPYVIPLKFEGRPIAPLVYADDPQKPALLRLEGERLWRSTTVTLGGQAAKRLRVLPDMQGLIAEFPCVDVPTVRYEDVTDSYHGAFGNDARVYAVPVEVWTSEGHTSGPIAHVVVTAHPADKGTGGCASIAEHGAAE